MGIDHCQTIHHVKFKIKGHGFLKMAPPSPLDTPATSSPFKSLDSTSPANSIHQHPKQVSKIVWPRPSFHQKGSLECEVCREKFTSLRFLDQHMKLNCQRVACEDCGKTYSSLANLKKHRRSSCLGNSKSGPGNIAKEIVEKILSDVFSASTGPAAVFKCPVGNCGQQFERSVHLKRHLSKCH